MPTFAQPEIKSKTSDRSRHASAKPDIQSSLTRKNDATSSQGFRLSPQLEGTWSAPPTKRDYCFTGLPIHAESPQPIQTKLAINSPGDIYEQEADRISSHIADASGPTLQRTCTCGGTCSKCQSQDSEQRSKTLSTMRMEKGNDGRTTAPPIVDQVLRSSGQPLDDATRSSMEPAFGHDFSFVRMHTDPLAAESSLALRARAYTVGRDIVFGASQYAPGTQEGRRLIAHELTHVVQQEQSGTSAAVVQRVPLTGTDVDVAMERKHANDPPPPNAHKCGRPAHCPEGFCDPYHSEALARYYLATNGGWLLKAISVAVDSRVVPFWSEYLAGGSAPKNITADFAKDFTNSPTTLKTTNFLYSELKKALTSKPPTVGSSIEIKSLIPGAVAALDDPASPNRMNFNVPSDIPGNIAGDIGKDETACPAGAKPSPFNDERHVSGAVNVELKPGGLTVTPSLGYSVKDTVDLCPGDCGSSLEQLATVQLSQFEATGIAGDVPFTVEFDAPPLDPFTLPSSVPKELIPAPSPPASSPAPKATAPPVPPPH